MGDRKWDQERRVKWCASSPGLPFPSQSVDVLCVLPASSPSWLSKLLYFYPVEWKICLNHLVFGSSRCQERKINHQQVEDKREQAVAVVSKQRRNVRNLRPRGTECPGSQPHGPCVGSAKQVAPTKTTETSWKVGTENITWYGGFTPMSWSIKCRCHPRVLSR